MSEIAKILQIRSGKVAALIPQLLAGCESDSEAIARIQAALSTAQACDVQFIQSLLHPDDERTATWLKSCGFLYLTDVWYMVCSQSQFPATNATKELRFVAFDDSPEMQKRLSELILRTYDESLDCPQLNNLRSVDDVLESYRAVGQYNPQRWFIVERENADVGCILLSTHPAENEWEVVYMGVLAQFRGQGLGRGFVLCAQFLARNSAVKKLSLAVDAVNWPALEVYRAAGFEIAAKHRLFLREI